MNDGKLSPKELYIKMSEIGMNGWISVAEGEILAEEIMKLEPGQSYLEVGVAYGKSLSTMAYYAKKGVSLIGIDILNWKERDENMMKLGVFEKARFIEGDSQQEALGWTDPIDLLFIDANHSYYGVIKDLLSWLPHVKHGGRIMLHDYDITSPGVMRAAHEFLYASRAYSNFVVPKEDGISLFRFTKI